ncbi:MAG TPA: LLM class flavin-dependent oxidoreductase, partial [Acidimicrobiales bacterium]|nr:LLM class flavin-dependent oxidoreductase [Acidimicrobiales bacterium]
MTVPLSLLDLSIVDRGATTRDALEGSVALARLAERVGYRRVWYAEHHNMRSIASAATSVVIAHVAAHTETIRLGAGGVMLPNHSPLTIAEHYGTLATLHPGRIDLGLGRAPGTDERTMHALRRDATSADTFPQDVQELRGYLAGDSLVPGVQAHPGAGTEVPLYILGSSLYGAQVAALLGLPYAFASHFAPDALRAAVAHYRAEFRPSADLAEPYAMAAVNVVAADTDDEAQRLLAATRRWRAQRFLAPDHPLDDDQLDALLASPQGQFVARMMTYTAAGTPDAAVSYLDWFADHAGVDELILAHAAPTGADRLRSAELVAGAAGLGADAGTPA